MPPIRLKYPPFFRLFLAALSVVFVLVPSAWAVPEDLHVVGNQLLTMNGGCTFRLKGVNVPSLEWSAVGEGPGGNILNTVAQSVTAWNSNVLRIPLRQDFWFGCGGGGSGGSNYRTIVDDIVNYCNTNNVYAILDLHWSGNAVTISDPCGTGWGTSTMQRNMPDNNSVTFWASIASRYANNPAVFFNLYNEPRNESWPVWRNGDATNGSRGFPAPGMQTLLNTVRATGANNLIVIGGLDWAYDLTGIVNNSCGAAPCSLVDTPDGHGVMYDAHIYPWKGSSPWVPADGDSRINVTAVRHPVIIGEFGQPVTTDGTGAWAGTVMAWMDLRKLHGAAWNMHPTSSPPLIANWSFTPTAYNGVTVKAWLATPVPTCFFTLTPTPTEVPCGYPAETCTPTDTPTSTATVTATPTPDSRTNILFPNPWDGSVPLSFFHNLDEEAGYIRLRFYTVAFRKVYERGGLETFVGQHQYTVDWNEVKNLAHGLYYVVLVEEREGEEVSRNVMKLLLGPRPKQD